jgi:RimJ/RimL family protein N-acetyltransferase
VTFPDDVPLLTDGVVTLRAHRRDDVPAVLEQCTDPLSRQWTTVPVPYTREHAEGFVTELVPAGWADGRWAFAVEALDAGAPRFCGTVELRREAEGRAEIAYGAHPWARGRGIIRRALALLLDWGFEVQGLRTVVWWANVGNWASGARRGGSASPASERSAATSPSAVSCSTAGWAPCTPASRARLGPSGRPSR